jgi:eukaryotic-like serine/threonine-protein kinase
MIGKTIGKYRIVGQLGRGGMGTVYKAVDETLDREVAIKVLNPEVADSKIMIRFRAEATALARLNHPEIATIYELFRSETDLLMVMEFVRGETLDKMSYRLGPLPPERAAYLIDKVLAALAHAHRAGIVHCDMKPANVMVTEHGGVKIMDFGVARVRGAGNPTVDGYMMGTPAYMPPEQVLGKQVDGRADLYAVGVILYRLLSGKLPFKADTAIAMVQKQISDAPTPLHVNREGLPDWCEGILQRALAKSPANRFQTADDFREALANATGMVTTDLTKAFFTSVVDLETTTPMPLGVLERFGLTPVHAMTAHTAAGPDGSVLTAESIPDAGGATPATSGADSSARNEATATIVLPRKPFRRARWVGGMLAGVAALTALVALWRPTVVSTTKTARVLPPAIEIAASSTSATPSSSPATAPSGPVASPSPPAAAPSSPAATPSSPVSASLHPDTAASNRAAAPAIPDEKILEVPFAFDALTLVPDGDRPRERESRVVLADGKIHVRATDDHKMLHAVSYDAVVSISYSRGRNPLWKTTAGPAEVARASRGALGIFRGARHWVSLRIKNAPFVVLRLGSDAQAWSAIAALEERTGRKAVFVEEDRRDDR